MSCVDNEIRPNTPQDVSRRPQDVPKTPQDSQDSPKTRPRRPQDGPRRPPGADNFEFKNGFLAVPLHRRSQDAPRRPQDAPKSPPGRPQDAEDAPQGAGTVAGTRLCRAKDIPVVRSPSFKRFDISAAVDEHFYCGALCLNFNRNRSAASSRKAFSIKTMMNKTIFNNIFLL